MKIMFEKAKVVKTISNILIKKKTPVSLIHFLTNRCNARCSFCFIDFDNPKTFAGELTLKEIEKLTSNMGDTLLNVNFTGGEPFARKDIVDIAKIYIKNTTIQSIYITTNASLPERILNFVKEINNFNSKIELNIQISIDDLPERHNAVRKIENLFESCLKTYNDLKDLNNEKIKPSVSITVTEENCSNIKAIFNYFVNDCKITSIKCCIVRDEGVYKTPQDKKDRILAAYTWLTDEIKKLKKINKITNYGDSLQGRIHNKKDDISWEMVKKIYKDNSYISPCHASSLFGVITADGKVYPCEILEDKLIGDLRKNNFNFLEVWNSQENKDVKNFILKTKCKCTYECAMSFNILGNWRYQHQLIKSLLTRY
jgi:radical SAM protein with 4Fe4S-binding SPASM domain